MNMNIKSKSLFLCCILGIVLHVNHAACQSKVIKTKPSKADYYAWIDFLTEGETTWLDYNENNSNDTTVAGYAFRVVITRSEIYNNIYIEKVTLGPEGCCAKVVSVRTIDMGALASEFGIKGEMSGISFLKWLSPTSFQFKQYEKVYNVNGIDKVNVTIKVTSGGG
jgi:hypothetical protein